MGEIPRLLNMKTVELWVPGSPYPAQRPRAMSRGKFTTMYMPQKHKDHERHIQTVWHEQYPNGVHKPFEDSPLCVWVTFYFQRPKSHFKGASDRLKDGYEGSYVHTQKPDIDNLAKLATDALNGLAYHDDAQIYRMVLEKYWARYRDGDIGTKIVIKEMAD
jgi:Holliday junction resolvase RusA-like endonuclease